MKKLSGFIFIALVIQIFVLSSCEEKENEAPTIEIIAPADGTMIMKGDQITIEARAEDSDGSIDKVLFYMEKLVVAEVTKKPYEYLWTAGDSLLGGVIFRVVAVDDDGGAKSAYVTIVVDATGGFNPELTYGSVTDFNGNSYRTIMIGDQNWMAENLRATHYGDGTPIPFVTDDTQWSSLGVSDKAYCWYDNMAEYGDTTGGLYSWPGAMNGASGVSDSSAVIQGVCPDGWHMPSDQEWKELEVQLGMSQDIADKYEWRGTDEGGSLKELGFSHWDLPNSGGDNYSGFTALPGGFRSNTGTFYGLGQYATFWSASEKSGSTEIWYRALNFNKANIYRYYVPGNRGASVRCVEDR